MSDTAVKESREGTLFRARAIARDWRRDAATDPAKWVVPGPPPPVGPGGVSKAACMESYAVQAADAIDALVALIEDSDELDRIRARASRLKEANDRHHARAVRAEGRLRELVAAIEAELAAEVEHSPRTAAALLLAKEKS